MHVVWFKRDLRIEDHTALFMAAQKGTVLPIYILEAELWQQPDMSYRQYQFLYECLLELDKSLKKVGLNLIIKVGDALEILQNIHQTHTIEALYSHQETWNDWTFVRDKSIKKWTKENDISWHEPSQNGVIRRLKSRDGWAVQWYRQMKRPVEVIPQKTIKSNEISDKWPTPKTLNLYDDYCVMRQKGGRLEGLKLLESFLHNRGEYYTTEMSSPVSAFESCSRLSAHFAFGTLSIREVFQITEKRNQNIKNMPRGTKGKWPSALRSFLGRLRWHCHFIQKLEDEPRIEFQNMHTAYDGLRENDFNDEYFKAWKKGETGYPMIDACMRALVATGWLNFRMRAMLTSFASYHLWLHWRQPALYLAQKFTDYEPGIHYSQIQMQSGTTGINSIRIYNPIKQGIDHDPEGVFIREWVPELADMPIEFIHTPWMSPSHMGDYPIPIVDEKTARKSAADKLYWLRRKDEHKEKARQVFNKHGSRKVRVSKNKVTQKKSKKLIDDKQGVLPF